jgi:hypothetical protein
MVFEVGWGVTHVPDSESKSGPGTTYIDICVPSGLLAVRTTERAAVR